MNRAVKLICVLLMLSASPCRAADLAPDQVRAMLDAAGPDHPADLSGKSLEDLDLSNLDFKRANLSRANLFWRKIGRGGFLVRQPVRRKARSRLDHAGKFHQCRPVECQSSRACRLLGFGDLAERSAVLLRRHHPLGSLRPRRSHHMTSSYYLLQRRSST